MGAAVTSLGPAWLNNALHTTKIGFVAWAEHIDWRFPSANFVDVVVTLSDPWSATDDHSIGLVYYPSGLVAAGVQNIREGERRVFRNVPVSKTDQLVVGLSSNLLGANPSVSVDIESAGQAPTKDPDAPPPGSTPWDSLLKGLGAGTGGVALLILAAVAAFYLLEGKAAASVAKVL